MLTDESEEKINRLVLVVDTSNFLYCTAWSAVSDWKDENRDDYNMFCKTPKETDQDNLPNILNSRVFMKILKRVTHDKAQRVIWMAQNRNIEEFSEVDGIDILFTEDSKLSYNFRKQLYPQYKAQRKLVKKTFDMEAVKDYIRNVLLVEMDFENSMGCRFIKVDGCESDDIIAVIMKVCKNYRYRIIVSSDRDFLQLDNVRQYDMFGKKIERRIKKMEEIELTPQEFLLWKILRGDVADNIKNVFPKYGDIKAYRLIKDKDILKKMLNESNDAAQRYILNKKLIDFRSIPQEMIDKISIEVNNKLNELKDRDKVDEFYLDKCIEL